MTALEQCYPGDITQVHGIRVGHAQNTQARTGVSVVLCRKEGAVGGVSVRGAAPGTRETDLLRPGNFVEHAHAVVLSGGSAYGLDAASGVMHWLEKMGIGLDMGVSRVPIVPAAVLYDLSVGDPLIRPDAAMGKAACMNAAKGLVQGKVGAGCGCTVGKLIPGASPQDGGIGSARKIIQKYILSRELSGLTKPRDYKTALHELVQRESGRVLAYRLTGEEGPDHN